MGVRNLSRTRLIILAVVIITAAGAFLRLYGLDVQSFWNDELESWRISNQESLSQVFFQMRNDMHPPGWQMFLYFWEDWVGDSQVLMRLPSAIAGVAAIPLMFLLGRYLYSDKEGLIAAAITAVAWPAVYFSQEARAYSMVFAMSAASTLLWLQVMRRINAEKRLPGWKAAAYAVVAVITATLHYYGLVLIVLQATVAAIAFFRNPDKLWRALPLYVAVVIAYIPWLATMQTQASHGSTWIDRPDGYISQFERYVQFAFGYSGFILILVGVIALATLLFSARGIRAQLALLRPGTKRTLGPGPARPNRIPLRHPYPWIASYPPPHPEFREGIEEQSEGRHSMKHSADGDGEPGNRAARLLYRPGQFLMLWLLVPFTLVFTKSVFSAPILSSRNLIISLPALYILLSRGITRMPLRTAGHFAVGGLFVGALLLSLLVEKQYFSAPVKEQFREATTYVANQDRKYQKTALIGYSYSQRYFDYYLEKAGSNRRVYLSAGTQGDIEATEAFLKQWGPQYVWYVHADLQPEEGYLDFLRRNMDVVEHKKFHKADVWLFEDTKDRY